MVLADGDGVAGFGFVTWPLDRACCCILSRRSLFAMSSRRNGEWGRGCSLEVEMEWGEYKGLGTYQEVGALAVNFCFLCKTLHYREELQLHEM